jgi:homospermidine synthase
MADHESLSSHRARSPAPAAGREPTAGLQYGLRVTRAESISLAGYFTMTSDSGEVSYRRSSRGTYRPADDAMLSWHELPGNPPGACPSAAGIVEADEIDFARCLQLQRPYPGPVEGHLATCAPLTGRSPLLPQDIHPDDPWQFRNVLVD